MNHFIKLIVLLACCSYSFTLFAQTAYFVSPSGSDKQDGSMKTPFKTIEKAQEKARQIMTGEVTIYLRQGEYHL